MNDDKLKSSKEKELGTSINKPVVNSNLGTTLSCDPNKGKVVSISRALEKKKLELINQIVNSTPSF